MKFEPRQPREGINTPSPQQHVREALLLLVGAGTLIFGAIWALGWISDAVVAHISPQDEASLFGSMKDGMVDAIGPRDDPAATAALREVFAPVRAAVGPADVTFEVYVVCTSEPNALALPGGAIVVTSGLLRRLHDRNELVFVLGHELGHFVHRDHLRGLGRGVVWAAVLGLAGAGDTAVDLLSSAAMAAHSRDQEGSADRVGLAALQHVYGHVGGARELLMALAEVTGEGSLERFDVMRSHPVGVERVKDLAAWQAEQGWRVAAARVPLAAALSAACSVALAPAQL